MTDQQFEINANTLFSGEYPSTTMMPDSELLTLTDAAPAITDAYSSNPIDLDEDLSGLTEVTTEPLGRFTRARNYLSDMYHRTAEVMSAARTDFKESDHKIRALALGAAVVGTEVLDRARLMVFVVPHVATEVLNNTHSPVQGALVGAAVFTAWNVGTGEILNQGLDQLPRAKESFKEEFPVVVSAFRDALPGANTDLVEIEKEDAERKGVVKRVGDFMLRHAARGGTGISLGTTAFVATSSVNGDTLNETRKQYLGVSADTAVVTGLVIAGVGQAIFELPKHGMTGASEFIYNRATDMKTWTVVAALSIAATYMENRKYKKEALAKLEQASYIEDEPRVEPTLIDTSMYDIEVDLA
jgi:hypothetical protein